MAIPLTGAGGLFTRLGRVGRLLLLADQHRAALPAAFESLNAAYDGLTPGPGLRDVVSAAQSRQSATLEAQGDYVLPYARAAAVTIVRMVGADNPAAANSLDDALRELIRQMEVGGHSVATSTVSVTATATAGIQGNGSVIATTVRSDGKPSLNLVPESAWLRCISDSYVGGEPVGGERFEFVGSPGEDGLSHRWPGGSNRFARLTATRSPTAANGSFENWTSAGPVGWTLSSGTVGNTSLFDFQQSFVPRYDGSSALTFWSSQPQSLTLPIAGPGSSYGFVPYRTYSFSLRCLNLNATGVAKTVTMRLIDPNGDTVEDMEGTPNEVTITLPALAEWRELNGMFRLPRQVSYAVRLEIEVNSPGPDPNQISIDRLQFGPATEVYPGGPNIAVFGASVPFAVGDSYQLAMANDRGGAANNSTFQALFDRLFGMRTRGLMLPASAVPTIADTLITTA